jgi:hypothetical protein
MKDKLTMPHHVHIVMNDTTNPKGAPLLLKKDTSTKASLAFSSYGPYCLNFTTGQIPSHALQEPTR